MAMLLQVLWLQRQDFWHVFISFANWIFHVKSSRDKGVLLSLPLFLGKIYKSLSDCMENNSEQCGQSGLSQEGVGFLTKSQTFPDVFT